MIKYLDLKHVTDNHKEEICETVFRFLKNPVQKSKT